MQNIIDVVQSDKLYDLTFTLDDANAAPIDITGSTLLFKGQKEGSASLKFGTASTMSIITGTAGTCKYTVQATDFDDPGRYYCEIEVTFAGGKVMTLGDIIVNVKPQLPRSI